MAGLVQYANNVNSITIWLLKQVLLGRDTWARVLFNALSSRGIERFVAGSRHIILLWYFPRLQTHSIVKVFPAMYI